jgi:REP element-mobilizing transposase RayT
MPRRHREEAPGAFWHVVCQGNDRQPIVLGDGDRSLLTRRLGEIVGRQGWVCHAWCLMTTHLHALLETPEANLGRGIQLVTGWYARRFNLRHGREGHLFGGRYFAERIDGPGQFLNVAVYQVLNPVLAGVCATPGRYGWSSYRQTAGLEDGVPWLSTELLLTSLDPDRERAQRIYRRVVAANLAEKLGARGQAWPRVE